MNKRRVTPLINRIYLFWPLFKKIISRSDYDPLKAEWIITTQRSLLLNKHTLTHSCDSVPTSVRLLYFLFTHSCFPTFLLRIQSGTIWVFVSLWVKYFWKPLRVCVSRYGVTNLSNLSACCFVHPSYYLLIWAVFRPSVICPSLDYRTDKDRESFFFFFQKVVSDVASNHIITPNYPRVPAHLSPVVSNLSVWLQRSTGQRC